MILKSIIRPGQLSLETLTIFSSIKIDTHPTICYSNTSSPPDSTGGKDPKNWAPIQKMLFIQGDKYSDSLLVILYPEIYITSSLPQFQQNVY